MSQHSPDSSVNEMKNCDALAEKEVKAVAIEPTPNLKSSVAPEQAAKSIEEVEAEHFRKNKQPKIEAQQKAAEAGTASVDDSAGTEAPVVTGTDHPEEVIAQ